MMGETIPELDTFHYLKSSVSEIYLSCWPKGLHGNTQTSQSVAKAIGCSPNTDSKVPLLKTYLHI